MRKYWKIKLDVDIFKSLKYIGASDNYIEYVIKDNPYIDDHIRKGGKFIFVCTNEFDEFYGWSKRNNSWVLDNRYTYCGYVNLRKEKLNNIKNL